MNKKVIDALGWYGTIAIVAAFALTSFSILNTTSIYYQLLNLTGALGIVIVSFSKKAYQPGVLNIIWTIIAFIAIIKISFIH